MEAGTQISLVAFCVGAVSLFAAVAWTLLRQTQGLPTFRRICRMAELAYRVAMSVMPSWRTVCAVAAGVLAFIISLMTGLLTIVLGLRLIFNGTIFLADRRPKPDFQGFADAMMAMAILYAAFVPLLMLAIFVGYAVWTWVSQQFAQRGAHAGGSSTDAEQSAEADRGNG